MVLQKLFDGSRNVWSNLRVESLVVDTNANIEGDLTISGTTNISDIVAGDVVADSLTTVNGITCGGDINVTGSSTLDDLSVQDGLVVIGNSDLNNTSVNGTLTINGVDGTPEEVVVGYDPKTPAQFTGTFAGGVIFKRFGKFVNLVINLNTNAGGPAQFTAASQTPIDFVPVVPVPPQFLPVIDYEFLITVRVADAGGSVQELRLGHIAVKEDGEIRLRYLDPATGTFGLDIPQNSYPTLQSVTVSYSLSI